jgi:hypothetical protein
MGILSITLYPLCPRQTRITINSWTTASTCFAAVWMWPPTHPSTCALSLMHLSLPYPCSQLWLFASGTRGTSTMTGLLLVLPCLMVPNCEQLQMGSVRPTMLVWKMYTRYTSSLTPQMCSLSPWTHLITWDNTCPSPFVRCWCLGSDTILIIWSTSTTSPMVWIWKTISLCTSLPL